MDRCKVCGKTESYPSDLYYDEGRSICSGVELLLDGVCDGCVITITGKVEEIIADMACKQ